MKTTGLFGAGLAACSSFAAMDASGHLPAADANGVADTSRMGAPAFSASNSNSLGHWNVFDATCVVGRHLRLQENGLHTAEDLLAEMDHYGIAEALVLDSLSRENHPAEGNERILGVADQSPRLKRAWSALPPGAEDEQSPPAQFVEQMRCHRVGALFLFPNQYFFELSDWCLDELLEPLAEQGVPVFINPVEISGSSRWQSDATDWNAVVDLCRRWPTLPVIVSEFRIRRSQRQVYKALDACPNLHIELSAYWLHRGIEYITERWGARRLLFGSGWPGFGPHMTLATLTSADIDDGEKRLIAGDNLRRLLSWSGTDHPEVTFPPPADEFVRFGRSGARPADMDFYDVHGHLGGRAAHYHLPNSTVDGILTDMDRLGVKKVCVMSFAGIFSDEIHGNDVVAEAVQRYPERFVGFTLLNPHRGRAEMLQELERGDAMGMRGVKLIASYQGYPEEGPLIDVACEWAHQHRQIIINHNWGSPAQMRRLLANYPNACFVTAHTTTAYADVMNEHDNLYVCSVPLLEPRRCEEVVAAIGADRFLFGSDLQDLPIAWNLGPILFARIPPEEKRLILGENLQRLLKRYSLAR